MEIIVAESAGFCFGVNRAVNAVYNEIGKGKIYTYGPIIHNKAVTADFENRGVKVIESLDEAEPDGTVIIRSHGVGKAVYDELENKDIKYVDGTCPFVKKIHNIVYDKSGEGFGVIIIGNPLHPEVQGISGWCQGGASILESVEDALAEDFSTHGKYCLVVQTTFRKELFESIVEAVRSRKVELEINNTICSATAKRQQEAVSLSQNVDVMVVIGDKTSSNTQKLYEICAKFCNKAYNIESICDLVLNNFASGDKIGITAGASTPPAIIKEVVGTMNELETQNGNEAEVTEMSFAEMLEESFVSLRTGDIVKGTVIQISNEEVSVNLGYKSDGTIPRGEFSSDANVLPSEVVKQGDEIEVFVVRVNDGEGNVLLSKKRIESQKGMEEIEAAFNDKTTVTGKVTEVVKGGLIAMVNGVRVFVPSSQVSNRFIDDLSVFKGQDITVNIIELDRTKRRIIGGRKALIEKELSEKRAALFEKLEIGQKINGVVSRLTDFGAFVDLGGVDGLIHISEMSWGRISSPKELLSEGQEVEALVLDIDKEKGKISLSLKDKDSNPWTKAAEKYEVGSIVEGKVVRMVPFGAFIELEPGVDGLVHISQIAERHVVKPEDEIKIGEIINVKVLEVNPEQKKISLSKKAADAENASAEIMEENAEQDEASEQE